MPAPAEKRGHAILWASLVVGATIVGSVLGALALHVYNREHKAAERGDSTEPSTVLDKVVALGRIEPRDGILSLGVPTPDRISQIKVREGEAVTKGQPLAILDGEVMRELERKMALVQRRQSERRLKAVTESGDAQIRVEEVRRDRIEQLEPIEMRALESKIDYLLAQEKNAQKDYERYLAAGDTIAQQDKEKQKLVLNQIHSELIAARCQHEKLLKSRDLNRSLADAQLLAARAELKRGQSAFSEELLDEQVSQAEERLKESQIRAPTAGRVLRILSHEGELVHGQPILQMANVANMIVVTEVYETDVQLVAVGQKATITSQIFKDRKALTGKVVWKAGSVGKARVIDLDPRAAVDNRVVDVKVELDQPHRAADYIGHQVRVEIDLTNK